MSAHRCVEAPYSLCRVCAPLYIPMQTCRRKYILTFLALNAKISSLLLNALRNGRKKAVYNKKKLVRYCYLIIAATFILSFVRTLSHNTRDKTCASLRWNRSNDAVHDLYVWARRRWHVAVSFTYSLYSSNVFQQKTHSVFKKEFYLGLKDEKRKAIEHNNNNNQSKSEFQSN